MIYVVSDIHGNYEKWRALLDVIGLTSADTMYVLGDTIDRGPHGIKILREMMYRPNVVHLLGNHEQMLMDALPSLLDSAGDGLIGIDCGCGHGALLGCLCLDTMECVYV